MTLTASRLPVSAAQHGIWMGQQLSPDNPSYLTAEATELRGALDLDALRDSAAEVLANCAALTHALRV